MRGVVDVGVREFEDSGAAGPRNAKRANVGAGGGHHHLSHGAHHLEAAVHLLALDDGLETVERDVVERGGELGARETLGRGVGDGSGGRVGVVRRGIGGGGDESLGVDVELAEGAVGGEDARGAPTKRATPAENLGRFRGGSSVARVGVGVGGGGGGGARANGNRGRDAPGTGASVDGRAMRATDARARTDHARVERRGRREYGRHRGGVARSGAGGNPTP